VRPLAILVGDATRNELDPDALGARALELFCARAGARVMTLPVAGLAGLAEVVDSFSPDAVVVSGSHYSDEDVARWAYRVRSTAGALPVALFCRDRHGQVRTTGARVLPEAPFAAHRELLTLVDAGRVEAGAGVAVRVVADIARSREANL